MNREYIVSVVQLYERIRQRPGIYIGNDAYAAFHFINGIDSACALFGLEKDKDVYRKVVSDHGWEYNAMSPIHQMINQGKIYKEIVDEVFAIEIATWSRTYDI